MPSDENATWTCFGCADEAVENDALTQRCPKCGGLWVRPLDVPPSWFVAGVGAHSRREGTVGGADEGEAG